MPAITALLHTFNDSLRLGRALETLRSCDEILVIDHGSTDHCVRIARDYGAIVREDYAYEQSSRLATNPWVLCLLPTESVSEALEGSLYEWRLYPESDVDRVGACSIFVRKETDSGWEEPTPETRLVRRDWTEWDGALPRELRSTMLLQGDLLRFRRP
jgi:glycosyltransferase involved in cell wall biosynthesis